MYTRSYTTCSVMTFTHCQFNCFKRKRSKSYHCNVSNCCKLIFNSIQFNSKTLFKDGDPISLQLIFPGAIQTFEQYNNCSYIYTKQHRFIGQSQANTTYTFIQKHIHKHSFLTYTMYIQTCIFTTLLSLMNNKEQFIVNNKHVEQERS